MHRRLRGKQYGVASETPKPAAAVFEDSLVQQVILMDMATFLVAERHALRNTSKMIGLAPDEGAEVFLATQVLDEARHFEVFAHHMAEFGVTPERRESLMAHYTTPSMQKLFDLLDEQIDKGSFVGAVVGQNLILEGMAFPVYRYEARYWSRLDPCLSEIVLGAFADEVQHADFGQSYLRDRFASDPSLCSRTVGLIEQFRTLMNETFDAVIFHYIGLYQEAADGCEELIGDLEIFPGRKMADTSEEEQVRILKDEIDREYRRRAAVIGVNLP